MQTPKTLLKLFRERCYEKAKESFNDEKRWVEILPYTVMEFNQRLREGDVLTPFEVQPTRPAQVMMVMVMVTVMVLEVMFAREPWEGVKVAPWVQGTANAKTPAGFVSSTVLSLPLPVSVQERGGWVQSSYFERLEHVSDEDVKLYSLIQSDIRRRAAGLRKADLSLGECSE